MNKGLLIAIEGIDGSGKTTQVDLLKAWLEDKGLPVIKSEWYRTRTIYDLNMRLNLADEIDAKTAFIIVAAEFAARLEYVLKPAINQGYIILCEKYIYTPMAKDTARGVSPEFVKLLYKDAPVPDITFYLDAAVDTSLNRIQSTRKLQFWESGMDMLMDVKDGLKLYYDGKIEQTSMAKGFVAFQSRVVNEYCRLIDEYEMVVVNKHCDVNQQQDIIRTQVEWMIVNCES
ncbi:dTMP kinase [Candidatus Desantisbacteria bacterium CG2_30_40_21]|uniref:Thymidylate kinase n=5 Tax=unclassified Candidatus Desantisiibacteriota TaxID=3106372 RepID=A0A2M7JEC3_9BACT|nr:MAG: dTMP kinase [Candidatus Desantisbacteria bacterium CG2_30_40_21]PIP41442.1 MAG: dTMP kinase [Candidatus Desantisbacteria bacterium CG23_combo_of_CG06-09_8_20_14_all_40_23]PIX17755.1 MAG: dTMP kinase [Candidatus Desantisbacteria bacterium CG_4_8_14_3_um_filter_40_12]PIY20013.1 MAG: dTMP kinase [Candidatus Desantisbacteria bacterium CG_4_10_14_3_um_filter_40_18]PJB28711.1 MAG: dTMP kinase [Candidatus Desantisbacteria bacterium CG_4_9_14_3_um_filter_40_11]